MKPKYIYEPYTLSQQHLDTLSTRYINKCKPCSHIREIGPVIKICKHVCVEDPKSIGARESRLVISPHDEEVLLLLLLLRAPDLYVLEYALQLVVL